VESPPSKRRILEKRGQRLKRKKRGETSVEMLQVLKKKERGDEIYKMLGETLSKERKKERKEITISYSAKSDVWPHPYQPWTNSKVALINLESVW
jgi:hypothetical protein